MSQMFQRYKKYNLWVTLIHMSSKISSEGFTVCFQSKTNKWTDKELRGRSAMMSSLATNSHYKVPVWIHSRLVSFTQVQLYDVPMILKTPCYVIVSWMSWLRLCQRSKNLFLDKWKRMPGFVDKTLACQKFRLVLDPIPNSCSIWHFEIHLFYLRPFEKGSSHFVLHLFNYLWKLVVTIWN